MPPELADKTPLRISPSDKPSGQRLMETGNSSFGTGKVLEIPQKLFGIERSSANRCSRLDLRTMLSIGCSAILPDVGIEEDDLSVGSIDISDIPMLGEDSDLAWENIGDDFSWLNNDEEKIYAA